MSDLNDVAKKVLEQSSQQRLALQQLLDSELSRSDKLLVSRVRMGGNEGFVASVTLDWVKNHIDFATNLPLLREVIDKNGNIHVDEETIELLTQRPVDYSREFPMAQYILFHRNHKFPALLAVLTSPWVDDINADEWTAGRAAGPTTSFEPLSSSGDIGLLSIPQDAMMYALDGQHRLLAIKAALEFIEHGTLIERDKDRRTEKSVLKKSEVLANNQSLSEVALQKIRQERIAVEILPAVMQGETREEARRRVRRIFVHVNRTAVTLAKGVLTALDEDSGFRIVARQTAMSHPLFIAANGATRVELEKPNLPSTGSPYLTTLEAIAGACQLYLQDAQPFSGWTSKLKGLLPNRPDDDELAKGREEFFRFVDLLSALPVMKKIMAGYDCAELRDFGAGEEHLLMRPVALEELAEALAYCVRQRDMDLHALQDRLIDLDQKGAFSHIGQHDSLWWGVQTKHSARPAMKNQRRRSATNLLIYLLGGYTGDKQSLAALEGLLLVDRTTPPPNPEIIGWSGEVLKSGDFMLPTKF